MTIISMNNGANAVFHTHCKISFCVEAFSLEAFGGHSIKSWCTEALRISSVAFGDPLLPVPHVHKIQIGLNVLLFAFLLLKTLPFWKRRTPSDARL